MIPNNAADVKESLIWNILIPSHPDCIDDSDDENEKDDDDEDDLSLVLVKSEEAD